MKRSIYNRERIVELRQLHPDMTLETIGSEVGVSKERVRQILAKENLPTVSTGHSSTKEKEKAPCKECGTLDKTFQTKQSLYCSKECVRIARSKYWIRFHKENPDRRTTYQCSYCGTSKTLRTGIYERQVRNFKNLYCSHSCSIKAQWDDKHSLIQQPRKHKDLT